MKYPFVCNVCSSRYTAKQIKNCTSSTSVTKAATIKNTNGVARPRTGAVPINYCQKSEVFFALLDYFQLFTSTPIRLVKKHLCNQDSHNEKYEQFPLCMWRKPSHATTKSTLRCQQWWVEYKGGHWLVHEVHPLCIVCTAVCQKAHLKLKWCRTVKK